MIIKKIKIFSQNIQKNNSVVNTILETQFLFDVIFIQELSWTTICFIPSSRSKEEELVEVPNYPNWIIFSRNSFKKNDSPRVVIYINIKLFLLFFFMQRHFQSQRHFSCFVFQ